MGKHGKNSKHSQEKEKKNNSINVKKIVIFFTSILILIVIVGIIIFISKRNEKDLPSLDSIKLVSESDNNLPPSENIIENSEEKDENHYEVLGVLKIDKINLEKNILDRTTDESLNLSVTKFYGPDLNQIGNFCITGHNYKNIFGYLDNLEIDDTFEVTDRAKSRTLTYKVYDKYIVNTDELECLNQETEGKKEVTLITCTPGGITRLIIKAKEV